MLLINDGTIKIKQKTLNLIVDDRGKINKMEWKMTFVTKEMGNDKVRQFRQTFALKVVSIK